MTGQHPLTYQICRAIEDEIDLDWVMDCDEYVCMRAGADWQLKQVLEWLKNCRDYDLFHIKDRALMIRELKKAMRPTTTQEDNQ